MSAHSQARRSTSRTAPDAGDETAQANGANPKQSSGPPDPSSTMPPSTEPAPARLSAPTIEEAAMLSALSAPALAPVEAPPVATGAGDLDDIADNGSSSLSELGDASDDQSMSTPRPATADDLDDDDSEAETERLENTPRKLARTATETSLASEALYTRTPSKLAQSRTIEEDESAPPTPSVITDDATLDDANDADDPLHSLSLVAASEAASLEYAGKKRKRTSEADSPADELDEDEPARKRSGTLPLSATNGSLADVVDSSEQVDVDEELEAAEERLSQLAHEEMDLEERQANIAAETVGELATVAKHTKPRKGGRRGKRKAEDPNYALGEHFAHAEAHDIDGEDEHDEEHSAAFDEEVAKKKQAIDELAKIEKKFKVFREKLCDEQIAQHERELEMLRQPNSTHPEYLAMIRCIDERRADKIAYEKQLLEYKQRNLEVVTTAERHQMHSQYFQTVRHVREEILEECNQRVFELQRGRRSLGCDETQYMVKLPEKRSDQIRHQTAYNLEVSILSGVAKYVGFPAAPDISPARPLDVDDDLRAMKIATRAAPPPSFRTYNRTTTADEAAAEEQFLESTPWANPRHPSHQEARFGPGPARMPSYQTPAGQRRVVDLTAPNGSASTIEANSNPPSSNAHTTNGRLGESESPVLQMKRHPAEQLAYTESPASHPRNLGIMGRDSYAILSSPAAQHMDSPRDDQRWGGGMRPVHSGASTTPSGPGGPGRADSARVSMTQRSGLGTVSVGTGLFGR
ncbi:Sds3-like-domain-containing protein [Paraphoma chrysanthemicola]|uniref:Sds3-like-domain-containing protein n=1 Tax=Paraphoma chrysanthemicola TaxID=798071 RepID=A0A8K0VYA6_9PLEO|nr:Sds3-like-domain-containing protein [Paraphoma chrysanthemicola]